MVLLEAIAQARRNWNSRLCLFFREAVWAGEGLLGSTGTDGSQQWAAESDSFKERELVQGTKIRKRSGTEVGGDETQTAERRKGPQPRSQLHLSCSAFRQSAEGRRGR